MNYSLIEDAYIEDIDINQIINYEESSSSSSLLDKEDNITDANKLISDYKKVKQIIDTSRVLLFELEKQK